MSSWDFGNGLLPKFRNKKALDFSKASVPIEGLYSHHFIDDLKKIASLDQIANREPYSRDFK